MMDYRFEEAVALEKGGDGVTGGDGLEGGIGAEGIDGEGALILVVEDNERIRRQLGHIIRGQGYRVAEATTGRSAVTAVATQEPVAVILDLELPDIDGREVTRQVRQWSHVPIIVLTVREEEAEKIELLDLGADDYMVKPFSPGELLARLRVALRHGARLEEDGESTGLSVGDMELDLLGHRVRVRGEEVELTPIEFKVLITLAQHAGKVLTHRQILKEVWGPAAVERKQYVRVYVAHLRRKIEQDPANPHFILTEPGVGYRFHTD